SDFLLLQYPSRKEVERIIREKVPEVMFLFKMPAYIYFVEALKSSNKFMSNRTQIMHRLFIKSLITQMLLPMFLMTVPALMAAVTIKFGSKEIVGYQSETLSKI
ncbi:hypothetical protein PMAYCL1PPCAC_21138, partial [Pristionchus mayeri]